MAWTITRRIVEGAKNRFRPIFLTSHYYLLGRGAALVFETSVEAQFLIPVALSVGFGVLFGTGILLATGTCHDVTDQGAKSGNGT